MTYTVPRILVLALFVCAGSATSAHADWDDHRGWDEGRRHEWVEHERHEHEWREHERREHEWREYHPVVIAPRAGPVVCGVYGCYRQAYYTGSVYAPPVYAAPAYVNLSIYP